MRWLALNKWLPFRQFRYFAIPSIHVWVHGLTFRRRHSGYMRLFFRCVKCGKRKWAEEIILKYGWCGRCFDELWDEYTKG